MWVPTRVGWGKKKKKKKLPQSEDGAGAKDKDGKQSRDRKQETHQFPTQWSFLLIWYYIKRKVTNYRLVVEKNKYVH